jgi:peroxiredoxin
MNVNSIKCFLVKFLCNSRNFFIGLIIAIGVLSLSVSYAQTYTIDGYIDGAAKQELVLCTQFGDYSRIVDTLYVDDKGFVNYQIQDDFEHGLYRVYFSNDASFDLILNNENINFSTSIVAPESLMQITISQENRIYYAFKKEYEISRQKLSILSQVLKTYPDDIFLKKVNRQFNKEKKHINKVLENVTKGNRDLFSSRLVAYYGEIPLPKQIADTAVPRYLEDHYWDYFPMVDPELINSNAYPIAVVGYLKLRMRDNNSQSELQNMYRAACDDIMLQVSSNDDIFQYVLKYLLDGFEQFEMWDLVSYLAETYGGRCVESESTLATRIKNYTEIVSGKSVPELVISDINGVPFPGFNSHYTLVIFWATWCEHCTQTIPELNSKIEDFENLGVQIIGISIDEDIHELNAFLEAKKITIPMYFDGKGWAGKAAIDYAVYATPSMYLIDDNGILIGKPMYVSDIKELINEIESGN